jgi:hypothetical protein
MSDLGQGVPGAPGSFPLPIKGEQGSAFTMNKMHPAAAAAMPSRQNPLNNTAPSAIPAAGAGASK